MRVARDELVDQPAAFTFRPRSCSASAFIDNRIGSNAICSAIASVSDGFFWKSSVAERAIAAGTFCSGKMRSDRSSAAWAGPGWPLSM